jgi:hypothetical protein
MKERKKEKEKAGLLCAGSNITCFKTCLFSRRCAGSAPFPSALSADQHRVDADDSEQGGEDVVDEGVAELRQRRRAARHQRRRGRAGAGRVRQEGWRGAIEIATALELCEILRHRSEIREMEKGIQTAIRGGKKKIIKINIEVISLTAVCMNP